jgi:translation initiation factor IF-3
MAEEQDLDLVLVSDKANPPVCRIINYGKYKFEQEKRAREAKKRQHNAEVKEVKMRYKIDDHDYNVRVKNAQRFLKSGDKVKATVMFRGARFSIRTWPKSYCAAWPMIWAKLRRFNRLQNGKVGI